MKDFNCVSAFIKKNGLYDSSTLRDENRYVQGECENDYKHLWKLAGRKFLKGIAKELKLDQVDISYNKAGISCSGDHTLIGMRGEKGIYISFNADGMQYPNIFLYRTVKHMKDWAGGNNRYFGIDSDEASVLGTLDYMLD